MPGISIERLRKIEWAGSTFVTGLFSNCCPACEGVDPSGMPKDLRPISKLITYGHQKDCWLGAACYEEEIGKE